MKKRGLCRKCGEPCGKSTNESLCQKCINSLPQCYNCGIVCGAAEWGYEADKEAISCILKKSGKNIFLCSECKKELKGKNGRGFLRTEGKGRKSEKLLLKDEVELAPK